jgi:long-chain acyl-CoA synthetase
MIVTEGGKNIYPEDIESVFEGIEIKEHCIFAGNYLWPKKEMTGEKLVLVLHPDLNQEVTQSIVDEIAARNRILPDFKRIAGYLAWDKDFPRTASMKIKRNELADQIRRTVERNSVKEI